MGQAKRLYRNTYNKVVGGVASGLAEYFDVDVIIFRLLFVLLVLFGGGGLLAYIIMWIVVPAKPIPFQYNNASGTQANPGPNEDAGGATDAGNTTTDSEKATSPASSAKTPSNTSLVAGIILILVGVLFLANRMLPWFEIRDFWPVLLIAGGFLIIDPNILKSKNRQQ
ncbi:MAG TPA: PspC domain-containing protein [Bacteroidetes bacterium]|nr:PspC domain-containing protein [Bacteroidota bacterium]